MPSFAPYLLLLFASVVPGVENPLPETIGLPVVFAFAGAGGVLAGVICARSSPVKRERWMRLGGLVGFALGAAFYLVALVVQVGFS